MGPGAQAELEDQVQGVLAADPALEAAVGQTLAAFYRQQITAGNIRAMVDWATCCGGSRTMTGRGPPTSVLSRPGTLTR